MGSVPIFSRLSAAWLPESCNPDSACEIPSTPGRLPRACPACAALRCARACVPAIRPAPSASPRAPPTWRPARLRRPAWPAQPRHAGPPLSAPGARAQSCMRPVCARSFSPGRLPFYCRWLDYRGFRRLRRGRGSDRHIRLGLLAIHVERHRGGKDDDRCGRDREIPAPAPGRRNERRGMHLRGAARGGEDRGVELRPWLFASELAIALRDCWIAVFVSHRRRPSVWRAHSATGSWRPARSSP